MILRACLTFYHRRKAARTVGSFRLMWGYLMLDYEWEMLAKSDTLSTKNHTIQTHPCRKEKLSIHPRSKQKSNMLCCNYLDLSI